MGNQKVLLSPTGLLAFFHAVYDAYAYLMLLFRLFFRLKVCLCFFFVFFFFFFREIVPKSCCGLILWALYVFVVSDLGLVFSRLTLLNIICWTRWVIFKVSSP
jgi:hypothetical protein